MSLQGEQPQMGGAWSRPSFRDQERRRGSDEVLPGTSVFPLSETGMSVWGHAMGSVFSCPKR